jgi:adenine-specific DNA-methyltransferase
MNKSEIIDKLESVQLKILKHIISNSQYLKNFNPPNDNLSEEDLNFMLLNNGNHNLGLQTHKLIISEIIYYSIFKNKSQSKNNLSKYFYLFKNDDIHQIPIDLSFSNIFQNINKKIIPSIIEKFHIHYLNSRFLLKNGSLTCERSFVNYKEKGAVYTPENVVEEITSTTIKNRLDKMTNPEAIKILDFGSGTGVFFINAYNYLTTKLKLDKREVIENNLWAVDIDDIALDIIKVKVLSDFNDFNETDLELLNKNIINKNLLMDVDFIKNKKNYFDAIISNPPYFLLKVNKKLSDDKNMHEYYLSLKNKIEKEVKFFRKNEFYKYSTEGMLNYYKLSLETILTLCKSKGEIGIICPSTLFADLSAKKIRTHIITNNKLRSIKYFPESAKIFDNISQSTVIFYVQKDEVTDDVKIEANNESFNITEELIKKAFGNNLEIPFINRMGWKILDKISNFPKLKEIENIRNKRGELDLTLFKKYITSSKTGWRLVRGNMIKSDEIADLNKEYVEFDGFLEKKSNDYKVLDCGKKRLICQQISNIDMKRRLNFVISEETDIIANSCNYLTLLDNSIEKTRLILNSILLNWRFKITSSNNHVNNYELDELPLITIEDLPNSILKDGLKTNILINKKYGLSKDENNYILQDFYNKEEIDKAWEEIEK